MLPIPHVAPHTDRPRVGTLIHPATAYRSKLAQIWIWGDVKLCRDVEGDEYLELVERQTKTGATDEARTVPPRIWANNEDPSKCVVATYRSCGIQDAAPRI
ncbi:hypothetical protein DPMN_131987 [Dreissena polymorpha]|uniref:Uncharacterized protein n=1 Tax=Dreissena polymorpha TaxID=45954 RepID=A0A9D4JBN7_DREPO|nr:hypothetical protein DPMN_131987 [Dreissena polymorpha]